MKNLLTNCDAILVTSQINRRYFTKFNSSAGMLLITQEKNYFLTDFRYIVAANNQVENCEVILITADKGFNATIKELLVQNNIKTLGLEFETLTVSQFNSFKDAFETEFVNISNEIILLRNIKSEDELAGMIASQKIIDEVFTEILVYIKENVEKGITEKNISAKIISLIYEKGAEGISFDPIIASGTNGASPHANPTDKKIVSGEFITMDFGALLNGYCSDMTRTIAVGEVSDEMKKIYNLVLKAQLLGIEKAKSGIKGCEIHNVAADFFKENDVLQYFGHGFGHGIGFEVHEGFGAGSKSEDLLPENAMISAEPGLYIENFCGVRIEDILILKKDGNQNITNSPKELIIL